MKPRTLAHALWKAVKTFPAVVVTGPRQSGKTTLLKSLFSKTHRFVSLENPDIRIRAKEDPLGFLEANPPPVMIDEIQYLPELLSYIKTRIDQKRRAGQWLFTGSQNFALMQGVSQSLAGRAAILSLLPFSACERTATGSLAREPYAWIKHLGGRESKKPVLSLPEVLLRGSYPEIASRPSVDRGLWCGSYISTYLERDVRNLAHVGDLSHFERFLKLVATRTGQFLHLSELAGELGLSVPTVRRWLSILEASYQVYLLYPYYKNLGKRLVKAPKIYFMDTGLASYLLGLHERESLLSSPSFPYLFETLVVTDVLKRFLHAGQSPSLYYLRTQDGLEVDLVVEVGDRLHFFEIKSTATVFPKHGGSLIRLKGDVREKWGTGWVISRSRGSFPLIQDVRHLNWMSALLP